MEPEGKRLWEEQSRAEHLMVEGAESQQSLVFPWDSEAWAEPPLAHRVLPAHQDHPKLAAGAEKLGTGKRKMGLTVGAGIYPGGLVSRPSLTTEC